ncbi:MAG TPA: trypsin-like peptidase domain-containing protein [Candidatus Sulfopaludibacter sp.]|jgi:serine protease Do|nr:trypsin-like peptidase domain-containing protein [Candidatus Sulfopaludibacter sp.]
MTRYIALVWICLAAHAQTKHNPTELLDQFSDSVQALSARVAPSVVQISVTRYSPQSDSSDGRTSVTFSRQQAIGSGVIIDPTGYIITNAHVVADAQRIRVTLVAPQKVDAASPDQTISSALAQPFARPVDGVLVGVFKEMDLALVKIQATGLPALPLADYHKLRQGQVVFAFGSRQGLSNSVSMGVVSSVARQSDPDSPFVYIQTDASINPGDSGGPLVNTAGEVVGLDTFIYTQSGGSEGIGFAIPSPMIAFASAQLRKYGHVHRQVIGVGVQTITATLAAALNLPKSSGVIISDVAKAGPAETAGVKLNDIVLSVDGRQIENLPLFTTTLLMHPSGEPVKLQLLRGAEALSLDIAAVEETHHTDRIADLIKPEQNDIGRLGIIGISIDDRSQSMFPDLRGEYGVIVAAKSSTALATPTGLEVGDVIHEINGVAVSGVDGLRSSLDGMKRGAPVALFIEREAKLLYISFELE